MNDKYLRDQLVELLVKENAHVMFGDVLEDFPPEHRGIKPDGAPYTPWQLLEHIRIALRDVLEYSRKADHVSPDWPAGYWPESEAPPHARSWAESVARFKTDLTEFIDLIRDGSEDPTEKFPWSNGHTLVREVFIIAKHNSYHLGQLVLLKKQLAG